MLTLLLFPSTNVDDPGAVLIAVRIWTIQRQTAAVRSMSSQGGGYASSLTRVATVLIESCEYYLSLSSFMEVCGCSLSEQVLSTPYSSSCSSACTRAARRGCSSYSTWYVSFQPTIHRALTRSSCHPTLAFTRHREIRFPSTLLLLG